jgi:hypothetical protein
MVVVMAAAYAPNLSEPVNIVRVRLAAGLRDPGREPSRSRNLA